MRLQVHGRRRQDRPARDSSWHHPRRRRDPAIAACRRIPKAKELIYTGRQVGAEEGLAIGYADKVAPTDELLGLALSDAADWATGPTVALAAAKRTLADGRGLPLEEALAVEQAAFRISFTSDDAVEGVNAFVEKREAHFKGS